MHLQYIKTPQNYPQSWWDSFTSSSKRCVFKAFSDYPGSPCWRSKERLSTHQTISNCFYLNYQGSVRSTQKSVIRSHSMAIPNTKRLRVSAKNWFGTVYSIDTHTHTHSALDQWSPTFVAPGISFMEDNFSTDRDRGRGWLWDISSALHI